MTEGDDFDLKVVKLSELVCSGKLSLAIALLVDMRGARNIGRCIDPHLKCKDVSEVVESLVAFKGLRHMQNKVLNSNNSMLGLLSTPGMNSANHTVEQLLTLEIPDPKYQKYNELRHTPNTANFTADAIAFQRDLYNIMMHGEKQRRERRLNMVEDIKFALEGQGMPNFLLDGYQRFKEKQTSNLVGHTNQKKCHSAILDVWRNVVHTFTEYTKDNSSCLTPVDIIEWCSNPSSVSLSVTSLKRIVSMIELSRFEYPESAKLLLALNDRIIEMQNLNIKPLLLKSHLEKGLPVPNIPSARILDFDAERLSVFSYVGSVPGFIDLFDSVVYKTSQTGLPCDEVTFNKIQSGLMSFFTHNMCIRCSTVANLPVQLFANHIVGNSTTQTGEYGVLHLDQRLCVATFQCKKNSRRITKAMDKCVYTLAKKFIMYIRPKDGDFLFRRYRSPGLIEHADYYMQACYKLHHMKVRQQPQLYASLTNMRKLYETVKQTTKRQRLDVGNGLEEHSELVGITSYYKETVFGAMLSARLHFEGMLDHMKFFGDRNTDFLHWNKNALTRFFTPEYLANMMAATDASRRQI